MLKEQRKSIKEMCREWEAQGLSYKKRYKLLKLRAEIIEELYEAYEMAAEHYGCDGDPMKLAGTMAHLREEAEYEYSSI